MDPLRKSIQLDKEHVFERQSNASDPLVLSDHGIDDGLELQGERLLRMEKSRTISIGGGGAHHELAIVFEYVFQTHRTMFFGLPNIFVNLEV